MGLKYLLLAVTVYLVAIVTFLCLTGCSDTGTQFRVLPMVVPPVITESPAPLTACPAGGMQITINGSSSYICNGSDGQTGRDGTTPTLTSTPATALECPAGGVDITINTEAYKLCSGLPATSIAPVQFCPGGPSTYSGVFAESGLCVGGQMYGVYSQNGGFLALLPPGSYSSNGINDSCTFNILPNCGVSQ